MDHGWWLAFPTRLRAWAGRFFRKTGSVLTTGMHPVVQVAYRLAAMARVRRQILSRRLSRARHRWVPVPDFRRLVVWIIVAIALPTGAWFVTAGYLAFDRYQTTRNMEQIAGLVDFAVAGTHLIHTLQSERSLSAARLAGGNDFFQIRLAEARADTQGNVRVFRDQMAGLPGGDVGATLSHCLGRDRGIPEIVQSLRVSVDVGRFSVEEAADGFSMVIEDINRCLVLVEEASNEAEITRGLRRQRALSGYKDFADLERTYGVALLARSEPDERLHRQFRHHAEVQLPYLRRMLAEPSADLQRALVLIDSELEDQIRAVRQTMWSLDTLPESAPLAEAWFSLTSNRLQEMHRAEQFLMAALNDKVTDVRAEAQEDLDRILAGFAASTMLLVLLSTGIGMGITRRIQVERSQTREIRYLATRDQLTGLYNRERFETVAKRVIERAGSQGKALCLIVVDLQRFGDINHIWGEAVGDRVLQEVARRLRARLGRKALIARTYGDEFTILVENIRNRKRASALIRSVMAVFDTPFGIGGRQISVQASGGGAVCPNDAGDYEGLTVSAQLARDVAKEEGGATFHFFVPDMYERFEYHTQLDEALKHAVERDEFEVFYQPRVRLADNQLVAVEALVRWNHPELGRISPDKFIPVAEENGAILAIGNHVLTEACCHARSWERHGLGRLCVSVNLSAVQFHQSDIVNEVSLALDISELDPSLLELELTETAVMVDIEQSVAVLRSLGEMGVTLSIDDFGTGYSSLSYLQRFPVQKLKLDKSFVCGLPHDEDAVAIARTVIALSHSLSRGVVAEGVENAEQARFLAEAGCAEGQGYYFSKPMTESEFRHYLSSDVSKPRSV